MKKWQGRDMILWQSLVGQTGGVLTAAIELVKLIILCDRLETPVKQRHRVFGTREVLKDRQVLFSWRAGYTCKLFFF